MAYVTPQDFHMAEIRVGRVVDAQDFPEARNPSGKLLVDFGSFGVKRSSAGIRRGYRKEGLPGRHVVAVTNFPPKQIRPFGLKVLCLGAVQSDGYAIMLRPDAEGELGARIA